MNLCRILVSRVCPLKGFHRPTRSCSSGMITVIQRSSHSYPLGEAWLPSESASYVEEMYRQWLEAPSSVHSSWRAYFELISTNPNSSLPVPDTLFFGSIDTGRAPNVESATLSVEAVDYLKLQLLVKSHQRYGHLFADLDPLEIVLPKAGPDREIDYERYDFTQEDLSRNFTLGPHILAEFPKYGIKNLTLQEIIRHLREMYASKIAIEYMHLVDWPEVSWIRSKIEIPEGRRFSDEEKRRIFECLVDSDVFERFVSTKFPTEKRFGLEGCEVLIPALISSINRSMEHGVESFVIGMPHRGRLNVLANVLKKPAKSIFAELSKSSPDSVEGSGDVKHHLGMNYTFKNADGRDISLSLVANPSHLESVNPVVLGKTRALQFYKNDTTRSEVMSVLIHGDAAFSAQGVVYESMELSRLPSYTAGGTIHVVVNNQIGFTTDPRFARSSPYCSDVAKAMSSPVIHVNGDDVLSVVSAALFAADWRAKWKKDIVLDIVCYRRHGHNEVDQPSFTQPLMYKKISNIAPVAEKYTNQLINEGVITKEYSQNNVKSKWGELEKGLEESKVYKPTSMEWLSSVWPGVMSPAELAEVSVEPDVTGVDKDLLVKIGRRLGNIPSYFNVHKLLTRVLEQRKKSIESGSGIDSATAEALCFGSLLSEGTHVRLSGQDVERGTFSHRHAVIHDQVNESTYIPLNNIACPDSDICKTQAQFTVCNSPLNEYGVLGYELGYSIVSPNSLVLWEAQFGDFANTAQCIIDQYIAPGEQKWLQRSSLVVLLPHGYDGQGPEHSSGHIERFLSLSDENPHNFPTLGASSPWSMLRRRQNCNIQVVYPTVPSNIFHALRRQVKGNIRKPLIVFESKALIRHPLSRSHIEEMAENTFFQRLIPEVLHPNSLENLTTLNTHIDVKKDYWRFSNVEPRLPYGLSSHFPEFKLNPRGKIKKVIFCSGQVYYTLFQARALNNVTDTAIIRIEQLAPFPFFEVKEVIDFYSESLEGIIFCQEEHQNHGAWSFVSPRIILAAQQTDWAKSKRARNASRIIAESHSSRGIGQSMGANETFLEGESIRGIEFVRYAGRDSSAAPATGSFYYHKFEEAALTSEALIDGKILEPKRYEGGVPIFH